MKFDARLSYRVSADGPIVSWHTVVETPDFADPIAHIEAMKTAVERLRRTKRRKIVAIYGVTIYKKEAL